LGSTGTSVSIIGSPYVVATQAHSSINETCRIDHVLIGNYSGLLRCGADNLPDREHLVTYIASGQPNDFGIAIDGIEYTPSQGQTRDLTNVTLVDICDPSVEYGDTTAQWSIYLGDSLRSNPSGFNVRLRGIRTTVKGTRLRYNFTGKIASLFLPSI
jgi:hypothetical protein